MEQDGSLNVSFQNKVATVTFWHPASNSFPSKLLHNLTQQIITLDNQENITVIVLKSLGENTFCAGASFSELLSIQNIAQGTQFFSGFANLINAIKNCKKIVIARVQGKVVGGGVGLVAACDYSFATTTANIKLSEIAIGIGPFVIEPVVSRKVGLVPFSQLALNPEKWFLATWAFEKNLYSEIFSTIQDLDTNLDIFTSKIAAYNPEALQKIKSVFWQDTKHWDNLLLERAAISGELVLSNFTKKALDKFQK